MASEAMLALVTAEPLHDERVAEQRDRQRVRVLLTAKVVTTTDEQPVKIRNLSATGALIEGPKLPAVGANVIIRRGELEVFAEVVWQQEKRCGVHFDEPLPDLCLWTQTRSEPEQPVQSSHYWRPAVRYSARPQPSEREIALAWVHPQGRAAYLD